MTRTVRKIAAIATVAVCASGMLAACGDDDAADDTTTTTTVADAGDETDGGGTDGGEAATDGFCDAYVSASMAFSSDAPDPEVVGPALDTVDAEVPEEIAEQAAVITGAARTALDSGGEDTSAFESEEFAEAQSAVDTHVFDNCEFDNKLEVTAQDYAFEGLPADVPAGRVAVKLINEGNEAHEIGLARKKDGVTESFEDLLALPQEQAMEKLEVLGGAFTPVKGAVAVVFADFEPGSHAAVCFVPVGSVEGQDGSGPPHFMEGMLEEFTVSA